MQSSYLTGGFDAPPVQSARAFRAALDAMARPGRVHEATGARAPAPLSVAAAVLLLTLCDRETPLFLAPGHDTPDVRSWLAFHVQSPIVSAGQAMFALGRWDALQPLDAFSRGVPEYPDRSATLIVELDALSADGPRLTGPGIRDEARLSLPETAAFRANRRHFPMGLDFFFTAGERLAALPRTTIVEES